MEEIEAGSLATEDTQCLPGWLHPNLLRVPQNL
jgi:hypothetical protein